ncbi:hypothetical protein MTO96_052020, partial [Rhipicephalus appendiculatus]
MYKYPDYNYGRLTTPAPTESTDVVAVAMSIYTIAYIVTTITIIVVVVCCCICWCKRCCQRCCKKKPPPPQPQRRPSPVVVYRAPPSPKQVQVYTLRTVTVATVQPVVQPQVLHEEEMYKYNDYYDLRVRTPAPTRSTEVVGTGNSVGTLFYNLIPLFVTIVIVCCCIFWCKRCLQR